MSDDRYWDELPPKPKQENTLETFLKKWIPEANPPQRKLLIDHVEGLIKEARIDELKWAKAEIGEADMILSPYGQRLTIEHVLHPEQIEERIAELRQE